MIYLDLGSDFMKKLKLLNLLEILISSVLFIASVLIIVFLHLKSNYVSYFSYITVLVLFTMALPIVSLIFQAVKEAKVINYNSNSYSMVVKQLVVILGVGIYLVLVNALDKVIFAKYQIYFYIALPLSILIPILVGIILNNKKSDTNKPKFIKNK